MPTYRVKVLLVASIVLLLSGLAAISRADLLISEPVGWRFSDGGNGHRYQVIHNCEFLRTGSVCESSDNRISWEEARSIAIAAGGHLATITSVEESDFVNTLAESDLSRYKDPNSPILIRNTISPAWWIGGFQSPITDDPAANWNWVTGELFEFTNWAPGEPNDFSRQDEKYLHIFGEFGWNDESILNGVFVHSLVVEFPQIPEPTCGLLAVLGALTLFVRRRI